MPATNTTKLCSACGKMNPRLYGTDTPTPMCWPCKQEAEPAVVLKVHNVKVTISGDEEWDEFSVATDNAGNLFLCTGDDDEFPICITGEFKCHLQSELQFARP